MKKDKEWLKGLINEEGIVMDMNLLGRYDEQYWKNENIKINKGRLFHLIDQLDEPETLSEEWIENHTASADTISYYSDESVPVVTVEKLKNLLVPNQDKPVIPDFMAYWIEENEHLTLMYIGFELFGNRIKDENVNSWMRINQEQFCRAFLAWPNVEVEKEKKYYVRAGNRYVRFNLDGSIIGVKRENSIVCLERLSKLPFDYKKAVESGIITLEEVTQ